MENTSPPTAKGVTNSPSDLLKYKQVVYSLQGKSYLLPDGAMIKSNRSFPMGLDGSTLLPRHCNLHLLLICLAARVLWKIQKHSSG